MFLKIKRYLEEVLHIFFIVMSIDLRVPWSIHRIVAQEEAGTQKNAILKPLLINVFINQVFILDCLIFCNTLQ